jgi:Holliday junction resolvase-like predicted endonuclease
VTGWKQQRIARMAIDYLARRRLLDRRWRFDVVTVDLERVTPTIEMYADAFAS